MRNLSLFIVLFIFSIYSEAMCVYDVSFNNQFAVAGAPPNHLVSEIYRKPGGLAYNSVIGLRQPRFDSDIANKYYLDSLLAGAINFATPTDIRWLSRVFPNEADYDVKPDYKEQKGAAHIPQDGFIFSQAATGLNGSMFTRNILSTSPYNDGMQIMESTDGASLTVSYRHRYTGALRWENASAGVNAPNYIYAWSKNTNIYDSSKTETQYLQVGNLIFDNAGISYATNYISGYVAPAPHNIYMPPFALKIKNPTAPEKYLKMDYKNPQISSNNKIDISSASSETLFHNNNWGQISNLLADNNTLYFDTQGFSAVATPNSLHDLKLNSYDNNIMLLLNTHSGTTLVGGTGVKRTDGDVAQNCRVNNDNRCIQLGTNSVITTPTPTAGVAWAPYYDLKLVSQAGEVNFNGSNLIHIATAQASSLTFVGNSSISPCLSSNNCGSSDVATVTIAASVLFLSKVTNLSTAYAGNFRIGSDGIRNDSYSYATPQGRAKSIVFGSDVNINQPTLASSVVVKVGNITLYATKSVISDSVNPIKLKSDSSKFTGTNVALSGINNLTIGRKAPLTSAQSNVLFSQNTLKVNNVSSNATFLFTAPLSSSAGSKASDLGFDFSNRNLVGKNSSSYFRTSYLEFKGNSIINRILSSSAVSNIHSISIVPAVGSEIDVSGGHVGNVRAIDIGDTIRYGGLYNSYAVTLGKLKNYFSNKPLNAYRPPSADINMQNHKITNVPKAQINNSDYMASKEFVDDYYTSRYISGAINMGKAQIGSAIGKAFAANNYDNFVPFYFAMYDSDRGGKVSDNMSGTSWKCVQYTHPYSRNKDESHGSAFYPGNGDQCRWIRPEGSYITDKSIWMINATFPYHTIGLSLSNRTSTNYYFPHIGLQAKPSIKIVNGITNMRNTSVVSNSGGAIAIPLLNWPEQAFSNYNSGAREWVYPSYADISLTNFYVGKFASGNDRWITMQNEGFLCVQGNISKSVGGIIGPVQSMEGRCPYGVNHTARSWISSSVAFINWGQYTSIYQNRIAENDDLNFPSAYFFGRKIDSDAAFKGNSMWRGSFSIVCLNC